MTQSTNNPILKNIPNAITCTGLLCGLIAIVFAFRCNEVSGGLLGYQWAWIFIGGALICDFLDGFAARLLHAYSELGKNLDSLSDLVSFGVAPCCLIFQIISVYHPGWSFVTWLPLLIPITGALRLARFNIDPNQSTVFSGLPIPANAIFWAGFSPLLIAYGEMPAWITTLAILAMSFLMITPMPMFSLKVKKFDFSAENILRIIQLVATVLLVVFLGMQGAMWAIFVYILLSFVSFAFLARSK